MWEDQLPTSTNDIYQAAAKLWEPWLKPEALVTQREVGYLPYARNTTVVREVYNERLVKTFRNYSDIISGHFYGHTHRDSIMVLHNQQGEPINNSLFVTPAVTPIKSAEEPYSNNPAFRILEMQQSEVVQKYFCDFMVSYDDTIVGDGACKLTQVCEVQSLDHTSYFKCIENGH
ncbi:unnamed protein product [Coregonus sp. 'balchen']|nr:unnamed protein product [Coregonus sp. 'balchen']